MLPLCLLRALLHEVFFRRAGERPAIAAYRLYEAGLTFAFLQKARLGSSGERPIIFAYSSALAGLLRGCISKIQGQRQGSCRGRSRFDLAHMPLSKGLKGRLAFSV